MRKNSSIILIGIYVGIALYLLPMYPHGGSANELTRWATAASLIEKGGFDIAWTEPLIGPNVDTARFETHLYSNKAPGPAIAAAPVYALARVFIGPPTPSNLRISWFAMRVVLSTLPLLLLAIWLYRRGTDEIGLGTLLFATPLFIYSLLFFSHVFAAVLVYAAFRMLFDASEFNKWRCTIAGAASGLAVISEFPAVFVVAVLGIGLLLTAKAERLTRFGYFILGGMPFAIFLLFYNNSLFGSPFSFSYAHESFAEWASVAERGFFGIGVPSISNAYLLLLSPSRGLFFTSPVLLVSAWAMIKGFDRRDVRKLVRLASIVVGILIICGHGAAHGGWAFGPRYLIFIIPLMLDPIFEGETDGVPSIVIGAAFGASVILSIIPAFTFPFAPPEFQFPHNDFWISLIRGEGWTVPTLANVVGVPANLWTAVPAIVLIAVTMYLSARVAVGRGRFAVGIASAAIVVLVYLFIPDLGDREAAFRRDTIAERYFKPAGRLDAYSSDKSVAPRVNNMRWTIADARAYAPDDFPYHVANAPERSPRSMIRAAMTAQKQGKTGEAEDLLTSGRNEFQFAKCEFSTNLAVLYFTSNRRDMALTELESVQSLVSSDARPDCLRSQYLLGSLYRELGRESDAQSAFKDFIKNSSGSTDPEIQTFRKSLNAK